MPNRRVTTHNGDNTEISNKHTTMYTLKIYINMAEYIRRIVAFYNISILFCKKYIKTRGFYFIIIKQCVT